MKVTLIFLGSTGAGPVYSLEIAKALAFSRNCKLQVIVSESVGNLESWKEAFTDTNVQFEIVRAYSHSKISILLQFFNFCRKNTISKLIKDFQPDILYVPFGLLWSRYIFNTIPKHIKIVRTIHDVESHDSFNLAERVFDLFTLGSGKYVDGYVILNAKDKHYVEKKFQKPVAVVPHASFGYYFERQCNDTNNVINFKIGFFGRIEPYKGLNLLIDAFESSKTTGLKLLIAGSGSINNDLLVRIENNDKIELINRYIRDDEFQPLLESVDFVVLPYKRASQSGVIPMCFAGGKTVVATKVGALEEQVPKGTGLLTTPDASAIRNQIDYLYSNTELIHQFGKAAKKYADEELSWDKSARLLLDFFNTL